jgi:DNA mismatch repair protein MutS
MTETKPLMAQYAAIKAEYPDAILLFQMGDFFECFYEDAQKVSDALGIVLTSRSKNTDAPPMAGFPQKALDDYLPKLIGAGFKVAVARQTENPKNAKGIVKRAVTEVITQGTIATQEDLLSKDKNYLACIHTDGKTYGIAFADLSTGEFNVYEDQFNDTAVTDLLNRINPRELLKSTKDTVTDTQNLSTVIQPIDHSLFTYEKSTTRLLKHFNLPNLDPLGLTNYPFATIAAAVLLDYIYETKKTEPNHITKIRFFSPRQSLHIDPTSQRNLEVFYNQKTHKLEGSLLGVLDTTKTAMGHRLLFEWLSFPETDKSIIEERYELTAQFMSDSDLFQTLTQKLTRYPDIQRLTGALGLKRIHPKHLLVFAEAITTGLEIVGELVSKKIDIGIENGATINGLTVMQQQISSTISADQNRPTFIALGVSEEMDKLVSLATNGEQYIRDLYNKEKVTSNLPSLKLTFNKVFGYSFELSRSKGDNMPEHFIKKQTLVNTERYITEELKQLETQVLSSRDQLQILESELYANLLASLQQFIPMLTILGEFIAKADIILSFASNALTRRYCRPVLTTSERDFSIVQMRHPVVESTVKEFVPNDLSVEEDQNFLILTGPNMGGKSTFVRQIALIQLMAQIGSYIPAQSAIMPIVDKVFARIGASDDISTGKSTFMVELSEVAYIVSQATPNSLVILDEVGRGTSTYEGISLAWGIAQYIAHRIGCTTIFTTHFRELTDLEDIAKKFINYKVNLKEENNSIYFLHTVTKGRSDKSYGIQVAKLVNLPAEIIDTAFKVLSSFEENALPVKIGEKNGTPAPVEVKVKNTQQLDFFAASTAVDSEKLAHIRSMIESIDTNAVTPLEALILLEKLKKEL